MVRRTPSTSLRVAVAVAVALGTAVLLASPAGPGLSSLAGADSTTTTTTTSTTTTTTTTTTTLPGGTTTTLPTTTTTVVARRPLAWPAVGSAAVSIPQLAVNVNSSFQPSVPIASLTKLMTAWVVLQQLPLTYAQRGPCLVVKSAQVAQYDEDIDLDLSSSQVVAGLQICEGTLLRGLIVHSASNYAQMLVTLTHMSNAQFVNAMNRDARALGMLHTHYADVTGLSNADRSTADDQVSLSAQLMGSEPVIQRIAALTEVRLPVIGEAVSYTPFIEHDHVVGIKSGITTAAGGCVAYAIKEIVNGTTYMTYEVVLGQHASNPLTAAGLVGLNLSRSVKLSMKVVTINGLREVEWIGPV